MSGKPELGPRFMITQTPPPSPIIVMIYTVYIINDYNIIQLLERVEVSVLS